MDEFAKELQKRHEKEILHRESFNNKFSDLIDADFSEHEKLITTYKPELNANKMEMIRNANEPMITFEEVNDKLEFITIHRPKLNKEIFRIPNVSSSPTEPFITVENPNQKEEIINIHRLKENDEEI